MKIVLNNQKEVTTRPWKGKDRKEFKKLLRTKGENLNEQDIMGVLLYNCIEEKVSLTTEEARYVIAKIREDSITSKIKFNWACTECDSKNIEELSVDEIFKIKIGEFKEVDIGGKLFKFSEVKNHKFYTDKMKSDIDDKELIDLLLHIDSIDGKQDFDLNSLIEMFDEMLTSEIDSISEEYKKQTFSIDDSCSFTCKCGHTEKYQFDELPEFLPESWFK